MLDEQRKWLETKREQRKVEGKIEYIGSRVDADGMYIAAFVISLDDGPRIIARVLFEDGHEALDSQSYESMTPIAVATLEACSLWMNENSTHRYADKLHVARIRRVEYEPFFAS